MGHCGMRTQPPQCTRKPARMLPHARTQGADALSLAAVEMSEAKPGDGAAQRVGRGSGAAVAPLAALTTRAHVLKYIKCDVAGAYRMYEMAMRAYAGDAWTYYDAALLFHPGASVHVGTEDVPRAEGLYRKAIAIDPTCVRAMANLGALLHWQGRNVTEAEVWYVRTLRADPHHAPGTLVAVSVRAAQVEVCWHGACGVRVDQ
jgi:tetratricopeptide (TPR) repeat protein